MATSAFRQQLIEQGVLRPARYEDGLRPIQLPPGTVVFRMDERTRLRAEAVRQS